MRTGLAMTGKFEAERQTPICFAYSSRSSERQCIGTLILGPSGTCASFCSGGCGPGKGTRRMPFPRPNRSRRGWSAESPVSDTPGQSGDGSGDRSKWQDPRQQNPPFFSIPLNPRKNFRFPLYKWENPCYNIQAVKQMRRWLNG